MGLFFVVLDVVTTMHSAVIFIAKAFLIHTTLDAEETKRIIYALWTVKMYSETVLNPVDLPYLENNNAKLF